MLIDPDTQAADPRRCSQGCGWQERAIQQEDREDDFRARALELERSDVQLIDGRPERRKAADQARSPDALTTAKWNAGMAQIARIKYRDDVVPQLMTEFEYDNVMQVPKLTRRSWSTSASAKQFRTRRRLMPRLAT